MDQKISDFLTKEKICSLTILLKDGTPHSAAMHFSHNLEPFELYFSTENTSRKCEGLLNGETGKAAVVVGFSEQDWITLQLDGEVSIISSSEEILRIKQIHYQKHPGSKRFENEPETVFLKFVPKWSRYTDFNTKPPTIITS